MEKNVKEMPKEKEKNTGKRKKMASEPTTKIGHTKRRKGTSAVNAGDMEEETDEECEDDSTEHNAAKALEMLW